MKAHSKHLKQAKGIQDFLKKEHDGDHDLDDDDEDAEDYAEDDAEGDGDLVREGRETAGIFQVFHEDRLTVLVILRVELNLPGEHHDNYNALWISCNGEVEMINFQF